jgi:hypothetical protein
MSTSPPDPETSIGRLILAVIQDHGRHCVDDPCDCGFDGAYPQHLASKIAAVVESHIEVQAADR